MTPEGKVKDQVKAFLTEQGCWFYSPVPMGYGRRGVKDIIGCYKGQCFGIETKAPSEKTKPWQDRETAMMVKGSAVVFDFYPGYTVEQFKADFMELLCRDEAPFSTEAVATRPATAEELKALAGARALRGRVRKDAL